MGAQLITLRMNWPHFLKTLREHILPRERPLTLVQLSMLAAIVGGMIGVAITALHRLIDFTRAALIPLQQRLEELSGAAGALFATTLLGGILIGLLYQIYKLRHRNGGIVHIIERLTYHQGHFPSKNLFLHFIGTALATATHQAVGREGAAAHMGSYAGSWLGQRLDIPTSSLRALVGCGAAAGISASFNTPLAGVIFVMEVVVVEYSVSSLAPSIVAAVCANAVAHLWLQSHPELIASGGGLSSNVELLYLALMGLLIGLIARFYLDVASQATARLRRWPVWLAMTSVATLTALSAVAVAELAVGGFTSINNALGGELSISSAASLGALILFLSALAIAAGLPGGVIMPCMLGGACVGLVMGEFGHTYIPQFLSAPEVYALLGLGAMLAAILQAPLTALVLLVELSSHTDILVPAMLVVITAALTARHDRSAASIFALVLRNRGLDYRNDPISQSLRRISVMAAMNRKIAHCPGEICVSEAREILSKHPDWLLVSSDSSPRFALAAADLLHAVNTRESESDESDAERKVDLSKIPGDRRRLGTIHLRSSLQEAWDALKIDGAEALAVERPVHKSQITTYGVLTREAIEGAYRA